MSSVVWNRPEAPREPSGSLPNIHPGERVLSALLGVGIGAVAWREQQNRPLSLTLLATGGYLVYRGVSGSCPGYALLRTGTAHSSDSPAAVIAHGQGIRVEEPVTIQKSADELYRYWRDFQNLPRFMNHLESVEILDDKASRWTAKAPAGKTVTWNATIIADEPGKRIAWKSEEGASVPNAGSVLFRELPAGRGTEVRVELEYLPPAGQLGALIAKLWGEEPSQQVRDDLRRFKNLMETGEIPTAENTPPGESR